VFYDKDGAMLAGARLAKFKPHPVLQILIYLAVMFVGQFAGGIVTGIAMAPIIVKEFLPLAMQGDMEGYMKAIMQFTTDPPDYIMAIQLFATAAVTVAAIVYCRFLEKRSLESIGITGRRAVPDYLLGWLLGGAMFSLAVLICAGTGALRLSYSGASWYMILFFFLGYMVQGMSEEVLVRGYLMTSLTARAPVWLAVTLSSLVFASMHLLNSGITPLAFLNLFLFGVFASLFTLRYQRLWGICAVHTAWNFMQGNFFGISVSGTGTGPSVFSAELTGSGIINGGAFGLEGGVAVTAVLVLACLAVVLLPNREAKRDVQ